MKRILGIDPGKTTGYVDIDLHENGEFEVVDTAEIVWEARFQLAGFIAAYGPGVQDPPHLPDAIVVESFRLYPHKSRSQIGSDFPSSQVIGIIELALYQNNILDRIVRQPASSISKVKIFHDLPASEHIRDAYKHVRLYIVTS